MKAGEQLDISIRGGSVSERFNNWELIYGGIWGGAGGEGTDCLRGIQGIYIGF